MKKLFDRDGGICWLCDWDDSELKTSDSGRNYLSTGTKYPSIDHVIPLSKGGMYTWGNVRLAHKGCNISKGDKIINVATENG